MPGKPRTARELLKVLELYEQGNSIQQVAAMTGVPRPTVGFWVKRAGISRTTGRWLNQQTPAA